MINKSVFSLPRLALLASIAKMSTFLKVSVILGAYTATFSAVNMIMPLMGVWAGAGASSLLVAAALLLKMAFYGGIVPLHFLAYYIPGLFACYYHATQSALIRFFVPFICMILFVVHPIGGQVPLYAMYWWVPMALFILNKNSLTYNAVGSTFVAHAVGSVIWLYARTTTPLLWTTLLPIVALERALFAIGMIMVYHVTKRISSYLKNILPHLGIA